ncbi:MAG: hypothetical protein PHI36_00550, partial [Bacteroidales bacterium]|nr:hypothetical protein [Bacteroidales bacterium]
MENDCIRLERDFVFRNFIVIPFYRIRLNIDTDNRKLKKYIGFFGIKKGEWESIKSVINLQILVIRETQSMNVLSISRRETKDVYKLFMILSDRKIELLAG